MQIVAEYTDTFAGEANYSWVHRAVIGPVGMSDLQAMRRAKALFGLTGVRGNTYKHGDFIEFRPYKSCTVLFVMVQDITDGPDT
jgi:hypothetical protein